MKIYTKKGDKGETSLLGGTRVSKASAQIEAYGTVDELNSCIGLIRDKAGNERIDTVLVQVQHQLFSIGSILASNGDSKLLLPELKENDIKFLESEMDRMDGELPELRNFILPGGNPAASFCHLSRCVCRRAERRVVSLGDIMEMDEIIIQYLNRLSDYLFVLARFLTKEQGGEETLWKPR